MALFIENDGKLFRLVTARTEYQMSVDRHSVLRHLWYGQKVGVPMDYLQEGQDVGFSGSPYDAGNDRAYSLDTAAQECPANGTGDYRISAIKANGGIDLRFSKYSVVKETVTIPGLPAAFGDAETLEITLIDDSAKIAVTLRYGVFEDLDIITRSAEIANCGDAEITLEKAASLSLDLPAGGGNGFIFPVGTRWNASQIARRFSKAFKKVAAQGVLPAISKIPHLFSAKKTARKLMVCALAERFSTVAAFKPPSKKSARTSPHHDGNPSRFVPLDAKGGRAFLYTAGRDVSECGWL